MSEPDYEAIANGLESIASGASKGILANKALRKRLLEAATTAIPELETEKDASQRIGYGPLELSAAQVALNLNLFETLTKSEKPVTTQEIATSVGGDPTVLDRILKYTASLRLIKEVDVSTWGPSKLTRLFAQPGYAGEIYHQHETLVKIYQHFPTWMEQTKYQRSSDPGAAACGPAHGHEGNIFEFFAKHPKRAEAFNQWMTVQRYGSEFWLDALPFESLAIQGANPGEPFFVDVGGGVGHQSKALLERYSKSLPGPVILQDLPEVIEKALEVDGMQKMGVDFLKSQPVKGARIYYLRNVLHDWPDEHCATILTHIKEAMGEKSLLLLDEMVIPMRNAHKISMQVDITMMAGLNGEERTEKRWKELLSSVGFKIDHIYTYCAEVADSVIVASPQ